MNYREATVYFDSGTGNPYRVVAWMAGAALDQGAIVTVRARAGPGVGRNP